MMMPEGREEDSGLSAPACVDLHSCSTSLPLAYFMRFHGESGLSGAGGYWLPYYVDYIQMISIICNSASFPSYESQGFAIVVILL